MAEEYGSQEQRGGERERERETERGKGQDTPFKVVSLVSHIIQSGVPFTVSAYVFGVIFKNYCQTPCQKDFPYVSF
jgi:hypothetical protein